MPELTFRSAKKACRLQAMSAGPEHVVIEQVEESWLPSALELDQLAGALTVRRLAALHLQA